MNKIECTPHPRQAEAFALLANDSKYEILGYGGAKGGGKSWLARAWLVARAVKYPKSVGLLIRKTYQDVWRNHIENFLREYNGLLTYDAKHNQLNLRNGSSIQLAYCDTERDLDQFQGVEFQSIGIDQAEQHPKKVYTILRSCARSAIKGMSPRTLLTFNPGGIGHAWLKKMFIDKSPDENEDLSRTSFLIAKVYDNPTLMQLDPGYEIRLRNLPEQLREAYLNGSFEVFEGQFFNVSGASIEPPWQLTETQAIENLYGSLDHGITHNTSFGLWYLDERNDYHRLFTYLNNGATARDHALEIKARLDSFKWTWMHMPQLVWYDPSMDTQIRLNESMVRSVIDEYKDVFRGTKISFVPANNNKENGCAVMRQAFTVTNGLPRFFYWKDYNHGLIEGLSSMVSDKNHPEQYLKVDGDDVVDECRYGLVGLSTARADRLEAAIAGKEWEQYERSREKMDWLTAA